VGKYTGAAQSTSCDTCEAGTFNLVSGSVTCGKCAGGEKINANSDGCDTCPEGTYSNPGSSICTDCVHTDGYVSLAGSNTCEYCGPGFYADQPSNTCKECPINSFSVGGVNECEVCPSGKATIAIPCHSPQHISNLNTIPHRNQQRHGINSLLPMPSRNYYYQHHLSEMRNRKVRRGETPQRFYNYNQDYSCTILTIHAPPNSMTIEVWRHGMLFMLWGRRVL
jgi:hypothetical protein